MTILARRRKQPEKRGLRQCVLVAISGSWPVGCDVAAKDVFLEIQDKHKYLYMYEYASL
jgi:hypothetical protein